MFQRKLKFLNKISNLKKFYSSTSRLVIYNNLTKNKEKLELNNKNVLYWYNCGPTVYASAHIGHAR